MELVARNKPTVDARFAGIHLTWSHSESSAKADPRPSHTPLAVPLPPAMGLSLMMGVVAEAPPPPPPEADVCAPPMRHANLPEGPRAGELRMDLERMQAQ